MDIPMDREENSQRWARQMIRNVGLRATPARFATLRVLLDAEIPLAHAEVWAALKEFDFDRATVFRNLTDLAAANLLRRSELRLAT